MADCCRATPSIARHAHDADDRARANATARTRRAEIARYARSLFPASVDFHAFVLRRYSLVTTTLLFRYFESQPPTHYCIRHQISVLSSRLPSRSLRCCLRASSRHCRHEAFVAPSPPSPRHASVEDAVASRDLIEAESPHARQRWFIFAMPAPDAAAATERCRF